MSSSDRLLFNRQTSVHQILGGGRHLILWRHKNVTMGILMITLVSWVMFERSNYTLLSYVSNVLLLLLIILFLWAKSAQILNRPTPPIPHFQLSEETINEAAALFRDRINRLLTISHDIALGKDPKMFVKVAVYLVLISVIGSLTDLRTLCYTSVFLVLTVPALYERYEEHVDSVILKGNMKLKQLYNRYDEECIKKVRKWILEKNKLS
ncbi:reticulon-like protein B12 isoform X2 [Cynara cardunculus var. scolymus]|uniref:reticulon-like protein B12 isoform X2 n=1 Tax=Cynara cardunculus var. scolymus TaxID=59895 RepID=UPI000D625D44|nr:reticulon-like protein B12 isoform X2 [Cynara cardunculus var. scolymus]